MALFTPETAADMAKRSWEARRQREQAEEQERSIPHILPQTAEPLRADSKQEELSRTLRQIEELNEQLDQCNDFKAWDALTRAKERLFRIWAHLAGIPGPGNLKPTQAKQRRPEPMPEPTPAIQPVVVQPTPEQPK